MGKFIEGLHLCETFFIGALSPWTPKQPADIFSEEASSYVFMKFCTISCVLRHFYVNIMEWRVEN